MKREAALKMTFQCNQQWEAMELRGADRYCASCDKLVLDFSTMTDAEIFERLSSSRTKVCARVPLSKLEPSSLRGISNLRWTRSVIARMGFLLLPAAIPVISQASATEIHQSPENGHSETLQAERIDSLKRSIQLFDSINGEPVPFAIVQSGAKQWTSDLDGKVILESASDTLTIRITAVGYLPETRLLDFRKNARLNVLLKNSETMVLGEIVPVKRRWNPFRNWF